MIKRVVVLSLLLVYLSTTVGFALSLHFCGTKISDIRINQSTKKPCCSKETDTKPDKCCDDKHIKIKVSDQQQTIQSTKIPVVCDLELLIVGQDQRSAIFTLGTSASQMSYCGPPLASKIPLTIQNCIFRI